MWNANLQSAYETGEMLTLVVLFHDPIFGSFTKTFEYHTNQFISKASALANIRDVIRELDTSSAKLQSIKAFIGTDIA